MRLAGIELYKLLISRILKGFSVIRSNRAFVRKERRFVSNMYYMHYQRMR